MQVASRIRVGSPCHSCMSHIISLGSQVLLMIGMGMKDEVESALCWQDMRWRQDGSQMGGDQDSTLVFWESTSCMLTSSVLTPLSYTGLSKADSSVMLSYGGEDVGILIDLPWSLGEERSNKSATCEGSFDCKWNTQSLSCYSLCKVDINPKDDHQDDCSWNKNCKGNIGSLHAIIHINNLRAKKHKTCITSAKKYSQQRNISILMLQCFKAWLTI